MNSNSAVNPWRFLKTLLLSYVVTVLLLFLLAFLLYKLKWGAEQASRGITLVYLISCALGGFLTGKQMGNRRLFWGLVWGILYFAVLLLLSFLVGKGLQGDTKAVLTVLAACLGGSAAGAFLS